MQRYSHANYPLLEPDVFGRGFCKRRHIDVFWQKRIFDPYLNMAYTMQVVNCPSASRDEQKHVQTVQYMIKSPTQKISRPCKL